MNYIITFPDSQLEMSVDLPASKSISNRALILNALSAKPSTIENVAKCDDTDAMLRALSSQSGEVNIGAAGTAMRFLTGYYAIQNGKTTILDGSMRMHQRPIKILVEALQECGAKIKYLLNSGYPPLEITGAMLSSNGTMSLHGNVSSQYISSLMMIAPTIAGGLTISLTGEIMSVPYIDMTIALMHSYGIKATRNQNIITIPEGKYQAPQFKVESDWSAASYWYEMASLRQGSRFLLKGLTANSVQGDSMISRYFKSFGVTTEFTSEGAIITSTGKYSDRLEINLINQPDLAQTIVVTACLLNIPFHISGLATLKIKETDRIEALRSQLLKLGYIIEVQPDYSLSWNGTKVSKEDNPAIDTFDDHRMAMAFAPAAIKFPQLRINNIEVVSKSYPQYWTHLSHLSTTLIPT